MRLRVVEVALGRYSSGLNKEWSLPDGFVADEVAARIPDAPEVWSEGSLVLDSVTGVSAAGAGLFAHQSEHCWNDRRWGAMLIVFSWIACINLAGGLCLSWTFADCSEG